MWNSTYQENAELSVQVATRYIGGRDQVNSPIPGIGVAVSCAPYNATYRVTVNEGTSAITVSPIDTQKHNELTLMLNTNITPKLLSENMWLDGLAVALAMSLNGVSQFDPLPGGSTNEDVNVMVQSTWMVQDLLSGSTVDLMEAIPSLAHNMSISVLSGFLDDISQNHSTIKLHNTTCIYPTVLFQYNSTRLLFTYGAALAIATVCSLFGFYAIHRNGREETLGFSRLLKAILTSAPETVSFSPEMKLTVAKDGSFQYPTRSE